MNSLLISAVVLLWFYLGYRFYGRFITGRLVAPDDSRVTPAHELKDGVDYFPSKKRLLWGNHFASIAGAGPIIGPILAFSIFGWGYTLLWVALGAVFLGAVHDYLALMLSVRHRGEEVADLACPVFGRAGRDLIALLVFLMLILLVTVFAVSVAQALINMPALVIPTFGLVVISILVGLAINKIGVNDLLASVIGVLLAYTLIWVGMAFPVSLPAAWEKSTVMLVWILILYLYCLLASVSPIWLILQPRDFISSVKLFVGLGLGFLGIIVIHPHIDAPFRTAAFVSQGQPVWPILFIMVACGAISGFHSLVASGTTARQLDRESDARGIAFGGMIMEGVVALLVVMVVAGGLKWGFAPPGFAGDACQTYFGDALKENWIIAFAHGFGNIVGGLKIPGLTVTLAGLLGAMMVKAFILTTLDSGTRLTRFIVTETLGDRIPVLKNRVLASLVVLIPAFILAVTNTYQDVWKLFGATNQLVAGIVLLTVTVYLVRTGRPRLFTLIPAAFMLVTTIVAFLWLMFQPGKGFLTGAKPDIFIGVIGAVLVALAIFMVIKGSRLALAHPGEEVKRAAAKGRWKKAAGGGHGLKV